VLHTWNDQTDNLGATSMISI